MSSCNFYDDIWRNCYGWLEIQLAGADILVNHSNPQLYLPETLEVVPDWKMVNDVLCIEDGEVARQFARRWALVPRLIEGLLLLFWLYNIVVSCSLRYLVLCNTQITYVKSV